MKPFGYERAAEREAKRMAKMSPTEKLLRDQEAEINKLRSNETLNAQFANTLRMENDKLKADKAELLDALEGLTEFVTAILEGGKGLSSKPMVKACALIARAKGEK